jgi:hypothetical protein
MPTDHATVSIKDVWVPETALLGPIHNGLGVAQAFVHENRIRQAASSLGATASNNPSNMPTSALPLERRSPTTKVSSFRLSNWLHNARCCANSSARRPSRWTRCHTTRSRGRLGIKCPCVITGLTGCARTLRTGLSKSMVGMGTHGITHSSTSGDTIVGTGLPRAVKRSKCARLRRICSALAGGRVWWMRRSRSRSCRLFPKSNTLCSSND